MILNNLFLLLAFVPLLTQGAERLYLIRANPETSSHPGALGAELLVLTDRKLKTAVSLLDGGKRPTNPWSGPAS